MLSEHEYKNAQEMEDFYLREFIRLKDEQGITDNREYHYDTPCTVENQIKLLYNAGFSIVKEKWRRGNTVLLVAYKMDAGWKTHPPSVAGAVEQIFTSHNKRFSAMAVGGDAKVPLRPLTACDGSCYGAPNPPLRQATGR